MSTKKLWMSFCLLMITAFSQTAFAQGLNWEGQTGAIITPFAYTAAAPSARFGKPEISFHYLNAGPVIGNDYQFSMTEGVTRYFEFGFTQAFSSSGTSPLTSLFSNGFSEFHGKLAIVPENARRTKWIPAISVGAIGRFGLQRVGSSYFGNPLPGATAHDGDVYIVATKAITQTKLPIVLSLGDKLTNASLFGIAGNARNFQGRLFGAAAFVLKGPARSALIFGAEVAQQPHYIEGLPRTATIPTSESYFLRVVPHLKGSPMQVDVSGVHLAGRIENVPGSVIDLQADARVSMGISYHF